MAVGIAGEAPSAVADQKTNYFVPLTLMVSLYFGIGFITAMNDILVPHFKDLFHLTNFLALLVQMAFSAPTLSCPFPPAGSSDE